MKIIHRYLIKELSLFFLFFVAAFYFFYVLIDYSVHLKLFSQEKLPLYKIAAYYLWQFSQRIDILFPLALMVATIKILTTMNARLELVALLSSGISFKKLFGPFLLFASLLTLFLYANNEFIYPKSFAFVKNFEHKYIKKKEDFSSPVYALHLPGDALLLYQNYNEEKQEFKNAFLILNFDEIYRMESLLITKKGVVGSNVDWLSRLNSGELGKKESLATKIFPKLEINAKTFLNEKVVTKAEPLSYLAKKISLRELKFKKMSDKNAETVAYLTSKLLMPLLPILVVMLPATFCIKYSRKIPILFIFVLSLFSFFTLVILLNSLLLLSIHQILPPFFGITLPFVFLFCFSGLMYHRT